MVRFLFLLFIAIFTTVSCMPEVAQRAPVSVESNSTSNNSDDDEDDESHQDILQTAKWYDNGSLFSVLTLDEDSSKNVFIYGDDVSVFLDTTSNFTADYCALIDFQSTLDKTPKQLRVKLVPLTSWNSATGKKTNYFRVNTNTATGNEVCNIKSYDENIVSSESYNAATVTNQLDQICTNCLNIITSTSVVLYQVNDSTTIAPDNTTGSSFLKQVDSQKINYGGLTFRVDLNNNSNANVPTCSNAECQSQGFDCCISSQCVNDGALKNSREEVQQMSIDIGDPNFLTEFDLAESLKINNPLTYLQYPQYYYICLETVPTGGSSGPLDPSDPAGDAKKRLTSMISDYFCIEELKSNSVSDPFHTDPYNSSSTYKICHISEPSSTTPSMFYKDVMKRMYKHCGCISDTYNEMVANCPKYTYKPIFQTSGSEYELADAYALLVSQGATNLLDIVDLPEFTDIARVECLSPEVDPNILPFQEMNVIVNSKSAPHRFFDADTDTNGKSIEILDIADLPEDASGVQEGDTFQYLDDAKTFPLNGSFNMNSILGQMNVNLSGAYPAKLVELEFDKMYYIATIEGYYTPCPSCAKDSWFPNFSPNPITLYGTGLQSLGYTTRRDAWGSNTTFGNYEDTIFGRACWVPPTMLPFSHQEDTDQQKQRLNRLQTQSAMFVNGYQRDWFGFNKGALIGSFDGVTWFAVGKGRVIKSTSDRLYLAINAPFADLTQYNDHIVSVQEWDFITTGPQYDYDPEESINSVFQNEAGLCQRHHVCETDSDCITQLGWEYSCVNVNQYNTKWPKFNPTDAEEVENDTRSGTIISFLAQAQLPPGSTSKRCVYRGAGSPCRVNYDQITDSEKRKALACAPNFYCAALTSGDAFNFEVARYASALEDISDPKNHYFGRDANHLGRPKDYISTGNLGQLPSAVQTALDANLQEVDSTGSGDFGICRPGKSLPDYQTVTQTSNYEFVEQQKLPDSLFRTDYISQISGCNSSLYTNLRYSSCPMLDSDGNYVHTQDAYINDSLDYGIFTGLNKSDVANLLGHAQNSCGLEALDSSATIGYGIDAETLNDKSAFQSLEGRTLASSDVQFEPTLVRDACYRKAGSVCHTDLDCSPNYKHADLIDILNPSYFGNDAEKQYWQEYLVCGQGIEEPLLPGQPGSAESVTFNTYDMTQNRCCREIGKDISMYTEDSSAAPESAGLLTHVTAGFNPNNPNRYSRYNNLDLHGIQTNGVNDIYFIRPNANTDHGTSKTLTSTPNIFSAPSGLTPAGITGQWVTINSTAKRTCCGGGWIRKFADGTNNWSVNRLNFDISNFRCLNFNSPLVNTQDPTPYGVTNAQNSQDSQNMCLDGTLNQAGCAQQSFEALTTYYDFLPPPAPRIDRTDFKMELETLKDDMDQNWDDFLWSFFIPFSMDDDSRTWLDWTTQKGSETRNNIAVKLPTYITWSDATEEIWGTDPNSFTDDNVEVHLKFPYDGAGSGVPGTPQYIQCKPVVGITDFDCGANPSSAWGGLCGAGAPQSNTNAWYSNCGPQDDGHPGGTGANCCYVYDKDSRVIKIAHNAWVIENSTIHGFNNQLSQSPSAPNQDGFFNYQDLGAKFVFTAPGTLAWEKQNIGTGISVDDTTSLDVNSNSEVIRHRRSAEAGSAYYYLKRLEAFELLGIPQITYMPLYCNDNYQQMVPGLFKSSYNVNGTDWPLTNLIEFNDHPNTFEAEGYLDLWAKPFESDTLGLSDASYDADSENRPMVATQELVDHEPIFSDHDFMCCNPLGTQVAADKTGTCCSGYAEAQEDGNISGAGLSAAQNLFCKLPPGTDLNVYFNKFVSSEGMDADLNNPLTENDFDEYTGYPRFNASVMAKLKELAVQFCAPGGEYAQGGAFGRFVAEPHGSAGKLTSKDDSRLMALVDSVYDEGSNNDRLDGFYDAYNLGLRWNHHVYCAPYTEE